MRVRFPLALIVGMVLLVNGAIVIFTNEPFTIAQYIGGVMTYVGLILFCFSVENK